MQSIYFLGSKEIGHFCFRYLLENKTKLNIQIEGILTNPSRQDSGTKNMIQLAKENQISLLDNVEDIQLCDFIISVQYHIILNQNTIDKAKKMAINLHMAPLPEYRGCNQFSAAIIDEKTEFGTTLHVIDSKIDHGDILFEKRFPIPKNCWVQELTETTIEISKQLFIECIEDVLNMNVTPIRQKSLTENSNLFFRKDIENWKKIDLNWDKEKIEKYIRATYMPGFAPPYFILNNQKFSIIKND